MKKKIFAKVLGLGVIVSLLSGCVYVEAEFSQEDMPVSWEYEKRIEEVRLTNNSDETWYLDYSVVLLDEDNETIYMEKFEKEEIESGETLSHDLEDIRPEYISYEKIFSMEIRNVVVYDME